LSPKRQTHAVRIFIYDRLLICLPDRLEPVISQNSKSRFSTGEDMGRRVGREEEVELGGKLPREGTGQR
jgi:hypothetical protein